jgi:membrane protease YdiL (CAAX protease family)
MEIAERAASKPVAVAGRPFSLTIYLLLVVALSWPFQIAYAIWGTTPVASYLLSSLAMVMVTVATFIAGRYLFGDGFKKAGWRWGKPKHYLWVLGLAVFVFVIPVLLELVLGLHRLPAGLALTTILGGFLVRFGLTLIPGFGEEFGWRAYMLPHLAKRYSLRKAVLLHAFIWWAWHLPTLVAIGARMEGSETSVGVSIGVTLLVTLIPAMMNAVIYAYVWTATQSLAVSSVYHSAYDEVRDALEQSIGFGPLVSLWEMLATTVIGAALLWKGNWRPLVTEKSDR